jgi:polyhydroxybutyrate depolymerase
VITRTKLGSLREAVRKTPIVSLGAVLAFAAVACSSSQPAGPHDGAAGQSGSAGASGASISGNGPAGGSQASGGNNGTAGELAMSGGGMAASGGPAGGGGGAAGSANAMAGSAGLGGSPSGGAGGAPTTGACTPGRPHAMGTSTVMLQSGGMNRSYLLHIPPGYDGTKPLPLVFDVHGYTSFASEQLMRSKWDKMADKEGFVLIDPDGVNKSWNAGSCCGGNQQDDVGFFRAMVKKATEELCIDSKRVYVSGHSNGGAMTYRLACEAAVFFAAVAPVCGWLTVSKCEPVRPIPVLAIRGLNDTTVKIDTADGDIDEWLSNDKCARDNVTSSGVCKTYTSCAADTQVMDCRPRGNHNFFYASNPDNYLVPDNAWPFFKQFSLP